jgi:DNA-binding winged helix-turn-helix (wHTH) protein/Tol biopolymer transport system component
VNQDTRPAEAAIYVFGSFTLDARFRRLLRDDAIVPLTTKAFDTLEVLVRSAGHTVSKDVLLKEVWSGTFVQEETLTQNISTIRRALGDSSELPRYVLTVPREGYRFIAPVESVHPLPTDEPAHVESRVSTPAGGGRSESPRALGLYVSGALTGLALAAIASLLYLWRWSSTPLVTTVPGRFEFEVLEPAGARFTTSGGVLSISPDGRHLTFLATDADGTDHLWIRDIDSLKGSKLAGTAGASQPFWSPESTSIAFFAAGSLRRIDISGGSIRTICPLPGPEALAGSWGSRGKIVFALNRTGGLFQVDSMGGTAMPVTIPEMGSCTGCLWPSFLPDGQRFLFTVVSPSARRGIYLASAAATKPRRLIDAVSSAMYVDAGYLLYASAGALVARRFDPEREQIGNEELPVADRVWMNPATYRSVFSASQTGVVAYREPQLSRLRWISRTGATLATGPEGIFHSFKVARDGRVLTSQLDSLVGKYDVWLDDAALKAPRRLTFNAASDLRPIWSADESAAVFAREGSNGWQLYEIKVDRPGVERPLLPEPLQASVGALTWDGVRLEYSTSARSEPARRWSLRTDRSNPAVLIEETRENEREGSLSPDRKWLAYTTNLADSRVPNGALLVRPAPDAPGRTEVANAASAPQWRSDSRELFFIEPSGHLMAQRISEGRTIGAAVVLCMTEAMAPSGLAGQAYDAIPDGQRFLLKVPSRAPSIIVKSGWMPGVKR